MLRLKKKEILIFGVLLQGDIFVDGYGTTEEDHELMKEALKKAYNVDDSTPEEIKENMDEEIEEDMKKLLVEYRNKMVEFLKTEKSSE